MSIAACMTAGCSGTPVGKPRRLLPYNDTVSTAHDAESEQKPPNQEQRHGPLFIVRCNRCRASDLLPRHAAIGWIMGHDDLHQQAGKEGKPF